MGLRRKIPEPAKPKAIGTCADCRWWDGPPKMRGPGLCRFRPPFARTMAVDWCSQHEARSD